MAAAYEPETHAGLTEQAALASSLHRRLSSELDRPLGLYEPLTVALDGDPELLHRLNKLDPEGGFAPDKGRQSALAWLVAGAVLEAIPAARVRHHFAPGLDQGGGLEGVKTSMASIARGIGSMRGLFTGSNFDGRGLPSAEWMTRAENDWGLRRFLDEREHAATLPTRAARDEALARALLAAGAILHLVEDAGDPAFARGDWRVAIEELGSPYERWVARTFGRVAVPPPDGPPQIRTRVEDFIHAADKSGLGDRTSARFRSPGDGVRLDERQYRAQAEALLPETARYAAGALETLFRGRLEVAADGSVGAAEVTLAAGKISLYGDDEEGNRKKIAEAPLGQKLPLSSAPKHVTVVFRGTDAAGQPLVLVKEIAR